MSDPTTRLGSAIADRYRLERQLGAGGMATVYLAHDLRHARRVALKVLRPELAAVLGAERFLSEIRVTAGLQHPHILPLHDSGEAGEFLYYVMPWVDGETLRERLSRERQLPVEDAIAVARAVLGAVDYAHRHGVIHRDIKPENILLHDGQPLLADFGIALAVTAAGGTRLTATGLSLGTPQYMSPEQAVGDGEVDERTDVYSLGAVLYEMLAGEPPHSGRTAQAVVAKVLTDKPARLTLLRETVPPHLAAAVHKALAKIPADRFRSAAEFAAALAPRPGEVAGAITPAPATPARADWRARLALPVAALAVALGGLALWGWLRPDPPAPVRRYRLALPPRANLARSLVAAFSPDGSLVAYVAGADDGSGLPQLYLLRRDQLDATPIPGTRGGVLPFFSPDGRKLGYVAIRTGELRVVGLGGEPPVTLLEAGVEGRGAWGRDGFLYLAAEFGSGLVRLRETGGRTEPVTRLADAAGELAHVNPEALPSGRGVLFTVVRADSTRPGRADPAASDIAVVDLKTGEHRVLVRGIEAHYAPSGHLVYATAEGTLVAVPFDAKRLRLSGSPVALVEGLAVRGNNVEMALSPSGSLVYVAGVAPTDPDELVWVDRDGTTVPVDSSWAGQFQALALSPEGSRLAVAMGAPGEPQVWVKPLGGGPALRLTFEGRRNHRPAWSPDGRMVLFESERTGNADLYAKPADGSAPETLLLDGDRSLQGGRWSRDGSWIVAREGGGGISPEEGNRDIIAFRPGVDTAPMPVVATAADEVAPALSPDGRYLAYVSDESGRPEVYVRPFPDAGRAKWQVSVGGGIEPLWAHSGRELFYRSSGALTVASLTAGPGFGIGERRELFRLDWTFPVRPAHRGYDIAPDDRRFVMIKRRAGETLEIVLIENWFEELEARVGH